MYYIQKEAQIEWREREREREREKQRHNGYIYST